MKVNHINFNQLDGKSPSFWNFLLHGNIVSINTTNCENKKELAKLGPYDRIEFTLCDTKQKAMYEWDGFKFKKI